MGMVKAYQRDHFFHKAKKNGHLARSYYKLQEADRKYRLLSRGMRVLDLGCSPGSWIEYSLERVGHGAVVGIDRKELGRTFKNVLFFQADIFELAAERIRDEWGPFDVVLSDMAPNTTGSSAVDAYRSFELSSRALSIALIALDKGGSFFCKIFQGSEFREFLDEAKKHFDKVNVFKPDSSKKNSREVFVVAKGLRKAESES